MLHYLLLIYYKINMSRSLV